MNIQIIIIFKINNATQMMSRWRERFYVIKSRHLSESCCQFYFYFLSIYLFTSFFHSSTHLFSYFFVFVLVCLEMFLYGWFMGFCEWGKWLSLFWCTKSRTIIVIMSLWNSIKNSQISKIVYYLTIQQQFQMSTLALIYIIKHIWFLLFSMSSFQRIRYDFMLMYAESFSKTRFSCCFERTFYCFLFLLEQTTTFVHYSLLFLLLYRSCQSSSVTLTFFITSKS